MNIKSWCLRLEISDNFFYQYIVVDDSRIGRFPYIQKDFNLYEKLIVFKYQLQKVFKSSSFGQINLVVVMQLPLFVTDLLQSFLRIAITNSNFVVCLYLFVCLPSAISQVFSGAQPLGGYGDHGLPHFNFQTKQGPEMSVSNFRDVAFYRCSESIRTRNFTIFTRMLEFLDNLWRIFTFSNYIQEIDHFKLDLLKRSDT